MWSFSAGGTQATPRGSGAFPQLTPPRHDSPHVLWPELRQRKGGSSHVGPAVKDYVPGGPPLQKKKSASARRAAERESRAVREPRSLARAHTSARA